jgi:hypothetical protein
VARRSGRSWRPRARSCSTATGSRAEPGSVGPGRNRVGRAASRKPKPLVSRSRPRPVEALGHQRRTRPVSTWTKSDAA